MTERKLLVADSPHLTSGETVPRAMLDVIVALLPVTAVAIGFYRLNAVFVVAVCVATALLADCVASKVKGRRSTVRDYSALLTGLIVGLCFSPLTGWWIAAFATFVAVVVGKEWMGGLGWNRFNPAALGRVSVVLLGPLTVWLNQQFGALSVSFSMSTTVMDAVSGATPLAALKQGTLDLSYGQLLLGNPGGALAETSALAILVGGAYLIYRRHITWHIPAATIGTVLVLTALVGQEPIQHVFTGGLLLGAFFMATDWVTSPITDRGRIIFGIAIGVMVVVFRVFLAPTEGVAFSILIMNAFVPLIDRLSRRVKFGQRPVTRAA